MVNRLIQIVDNPVQDIQNRFFFIGSDAVKQDPVDLVLGVLVRGNDGHGIGGDADVQETAVVHVFPYMDESPFL